MVATIAVAVILGSGPSLVTAQGTGSKSEADPPESTTVESSDDDTGLEKPVIETFDLNAYPETAKKSPGDKWDTFVDGLRGLLVWDFFDGRVTVRAHTRVQIDGTAATGNDQLESMYGELGTSLDVRRFQVFAQGTIDHRMRYNISFNFGPDSGFGEIFLEGRDEGLRIFGYRIGQFRVGTFQEPFSFERVQSSYYTGFVERSLPVWAFSPGNNLGYMVHDTVKSGRFSWSAGFFSFGQQNEQNSSNSSLSVTGRVTGLPIYRDEGRTLLHLGASFSTRSPQGSEARYRSRPEARFVDFFVDTGEFDAGKIQLGGIEMVAMRGPLSVQSEFIASKVEGTDSGDRLFWGGYVQVGWFLTGDRRVYDEQLGVYSRVVPTRQRKNLFKRGGGGALELTGRISTIDLDDGPITGGRMTDVTFGVNWYLTATSAVRLNYIHSDVKDRGRANILVLRYQFRPLPVPGWR